MMNEVREGQGLVVLVDDDPAITALVERWISSDGFECETFADAESAIQGFSQLLPDCLLLDLHLPGIDGMRALEIIHARHPMLPVIVLTADQTVETAVEAMRLGAYDYLTKPLDRTQLVTTLRNATQHQRMSLRLAQLEREAEGHGYPGIVGASPSMRDLFRQLDRVAPSDVTVLIRGESGTGKELVARAIHANSGRSGGAFVALNCAAIPENLQESELFGHEKGAFTGATSRRIGRFEQAHQGTLFLDELGDLALAAQAKLLRATQDQRFQRVGGTTEIESDFRLVAATHQDLEELVRTGGFREDLFYRVAVFEINLPPLRDRKEDIPLLVEALAQRYWADRPGRIPELSPAASSALMSHDWPGNVRELQNAVQRALVTCSDGQIRRTDLPPRIAGAGGFAAAQSVFRRGQADGTSATTSFSASEPSQALPGQSPPTVDSSTPGQSRPSAGELGSEPLSLREIERLAILDAMERTGGNVSEVAQQLGVGRTTLYRKLKEYGLR